MSRTMVIAAALAALLVGACEQGPLQGAMQPPAGAAGTYVFNDGSHRYAIQLDPSWQIASSIEAGTFSRNAQRNSRVAEDRVTKLQARYKATTPRREAAVLNAGFDESSGGRGQTTAQRAAAQRTTEANRCGGQRLPDVPQQRTADGRAAHIVLICRTNDLPAGAVAFVDDPVRPYLAIAHGTQGDYWRDPVLNREVLDAFLAVVRSYKSGG
jgi:hypothetical protein